MGWEEGQGRAPAAKWARELPGRRSSLLQAHEKAKRETRSGNGAHCRIGICHPDCSVCEAQMSFHLLPRWAIFHGSKLLSFRCAASRTKRISALTGYRHKKIIGRSNGLLNMKQSIGILDLAIFQVLEKAKPFSKWKKKKKEKTFLPAILKMAVSSINNLIGNGFNPAYEDLCP